MNTDKIIIPIYLDTEGESINAFEVKIKISDNLIFRDYLEKDSIISYWIERPHVVERSSLPGKPNVVEKSSPQGSTTENLSRSEPQGSTTEINFSGITPGGYIGKKALLVNLIFEAKQSGSAFIEILPSSNVLLNDSLGTKAKLITEKYSFILNRTQEKKIIIQDNYPPEPFKVYLQKDKEIFNNKYYLVFYAQDKQSGISYYEVKEGDYDFEKASSPYLLKDQSLRSYVYIKAVDRAGNERIEIFKPRKLFLLEEILSLIFFIVIIFLIFLIFNKKFKK
ncbi:MAG: hypothetical protein KatS3mg094_181 [Candidatus Parcubacteria bacterium]|nr:MAG: hypothetical protein KatS3mg094_181 [Candidatus Parcubacteria bacterium]